MLTIESATCQRVAVSHPEGCSLTSLGALSSDPRIGVQDQNEHITDGIRQQCLSTPLLSTWLTTIINSVFVATDNVC